MGLGGFAPKNTSTSPQATTQQGESSGGEAGETSATGAPKPPTRTWTNLLSTAEGKKQKAAAQQDMQAADADDDRKIRFTIGGEGQRMTKEDFIRQVQQLDAKTRREVIERANAPQRVKNVAKQEDPATSTAIPQIFEHQASSSDAPSAAPLSTHKPHAPQPSEQTGETAAERKRRLAVLATQADEGDNEETPAERRRREAALGMGEGDGDSDNEEAAGTGARIRFAEPQRGRK